MKKIIRSTFAAIALGLLFSIPYAAPIDAAAKFDDSINLTTIAKLPACNVNNSGSSAAVSDYNGSIAWGAAVGTGGGTGVARVYCNGATWTVFAGGGGGSNTTTQNVALSAPTTTLGNYATGSCTNTPFIADGQHSCLTFDDHWSASTLNLTNWWPGLTICKNNADNFGVQGQENCYPWPGGFPVAINYPLSMWCSVNVGGCFNNVLYDPTFANVPAVTGLNLNGFVPMAKGGDGTLALGLKYFYPLGTGPQASWCTSSGNNDCTQISFIGSGMTAGGMSSTTEGQTGSVLNNAALIPATGGLLQWRSKFDIGLSFGEFPGMECDAVGGANSGEALNGNMEFGYTNNGGEPTGLQWFGLGMNNLPVGNTQVLAGDSPPTGGPGVGSGDLRNWHTYGLEWSGTTPGVWRWYVDGALRGSATETINTNPTVGFNCKWYLDMGDDAENSFHTTWPRVNGVATQPGPFFWNFSDVQLYRKPGT